MPEASIRALDEAARPSLSRLEFADEILRAAASPERIGSIVTGVLCDRLDVGPIGFGPAGILSAHAVGRAHPATIEPHPDDHCALDLHIPLALRIDVRIGSVVARFGAGVRLRARLTLELDRPCTVIVRHRPVRTEDVVARVRGLNPIGRAAMEFVPVGRLVASRVAAHANTVFADPEVARLTRIDVVQLIGRAWDAGLVLDAGHSTA
ncbi:hypothetical protein JMUB6875_58440 [Nocardia sp. JMUB6875]|uniref:hypothetical protein n=1 Tax=Nocardia sp. JMUB6875 TaxID=3158170 RepID=UPI0032E7021B